MAMVTGGQSSRGALLLDTDANLGQLLQGAHPLTVQFFQEDPGAKQAPIFVPVPDDPPSPPHPPTGSGEGRGGNPHGSMQPQRVLFTNPGSGNVSDCPSKPTPSGGEAVCWDNVFVATSSEGWFRSYTTKVPGSTVWMDLGPASAPVDS